MGLFCVGMMLCVFLAPVRIAAPLTGFVAASAALLGARIPLKTYLRAISVPFGFIAIGALVVSVNIGAGDTWVRFAPEGRALAIDTSLRSLAAVNVLTCFACTVPTSRWIAWLQRAHLPHPVIDVFHLTYRTIFLLDEQRVVLTRAAANRLAGQSMASRLRASGHLGAALFVRTLDRAQRLERGLAARGYADSLAVLQPTTTSRPHNYILALGVPLAVAGFILVGAGSP